MRYVATGMNASGESQQIVVNADSEADALAMAEAKGLSDVQIKLGPDHNKSLGKEEAIRASGSARGGGQRMQAKKGSTMGGLIKLAVLLVILVVLVVAAMQFGVIDMILGGAE